MYGSQRIFSCGNPSPKTVGNVAKRRSVHFGVYNVRLLSALDKLLRDKPLYLGELSTSINDALLAVDLNTIELVNLQSRQKQTGRETQVVILRRLRKRIHQVAQKRKCSMNELVNSALLAYCSKAAEGKGSTNDAEDPRIRTTECRSWSGRSFTSCSRGSQQCNHSPSMQKSLMGRTTNTIAI